MKLLLYIGAAGFAGAISRYVISVWIYSATSGKFPFGTLAVNIIGSMLLGLAYTLSMERVLLPPEIKIAIAVGFLGSFTTFSTFTLETFHLFNEGNIILSITNAFLNLSLSLIALILGIALAKIF